MKFAISDQELREGSDEERAAKGEQLLRAAVGKTNGEIKLVDEEIAHFERQANFSSAEMRAKLDRGEIQETWDICQWLLALTLRQRLPQTRRPDIVPWAGVH